MFRKIRSDREPGVTLLGEVRKEFAVHFSAFRDRLRWFLLRWPRFSFGLMVFLMSASLVMSFVVFRREIKPVPSVADGVKPVASGMSDLLRQGSRINRTLAIRKEIEQMLEQDSLSPADSVRLEAAIDELHALSISTADPGVR